MVKFIEVAECNLIIADNEIKVKETILLNIEEIKWIEIQKFSSGYAIIVVTDEDWYVYDCKFEKEIEAYEKMIELKEELNK